MRHRRTVGYLVQVPAQSERDALKEEVDADEGGGPDGGRPEAQAPTGFGEREEDEKIRQAVFVVEWHVPTFGRWPCLPTGKRFRQRQSTADQCDRRLGVDEGGPSERLQPERGRHQEGRRHHGHDDDEHR